MKTIKCLVALALCPVGLAFAVTPKTVSTVAELEDAVWNAESEDVILVNEGTYELSTGTHNSQPGHLYASKTITLQGVPGDASKVVLKGNSANRILYCGANDIVLRNLTFANGNSSSYATASTTPADSTKGGALLLNGSHVTVSNCIFLANEGMDYGGACATYQTINATYQQMDFFDCMFTNNTSKLGGAIYRGNIVSNCVFIGNTASSSSGTRRGGAIYNTTMVIDCAFTNNCADNSGGAVAFAADSKVSGFKVAGCDFHGNCAKTSGSALWSHASVSDIVLVSNCTFSSNGAYAGTTPNGVIDCFSNVVHCTFTGNAGKNGGAAYNSRLVGCSMAGNAATEGGAAYNSFLKGCLVENNESQRAGGAAYGSVLVSCTNRSNRAVASGKEYFTELSNGCEAEGCMFEFAGMDDKVAFGAGSFNRCKFLCQTNGIIFINAPALTNCLVASATNCYFFYKTSSEASMVNCTVVSNVFIGPNAGGQTGKFVVANTFFFGNKCNGGARDYDIDANYGNIVSSFVNCIMSAANDNYIPGTGNYNYYSERDTINPGFVGAEKDQENPFAITRRSPAFEMAGIVEDWMATATDIRGEGFPRIRDGKVNIGCYQCLDAAPGLVIMFR